MNPVVYAAALLNDVGQPITEAKLFEVLLRAGADSSQYTDQIKMVAQAATEIDFAAEIAKIRAMPKASIPTVVTPTEAPKRAEPEPVKEDADQFGFDKLFGN